MNHLPPDDAQHALNQAREIGDSTGFRALLTGIGTMLGAGATLMLSRFISRKPHRHQEPPEATATNPGALADAKEHGEAEARLTVLEGQLKAVWEKHDDLADEVVEMGKQLAALPDRTEWLRMEDRIISAVNRASEINNNLLREHIREYHSRG